VQTIEQGKLIEIDAVNRSFHLQEDSGEYPVTAAAK